MMYQPEHIASVDNDYDDEILGCINLNGSWGVHLAGHYARPLDTVILMQSTGLCDKNGKEIFEGDVLKATRIGLYGKYNGRPYYVVAIVEYRGGIEYEVGSGCDVLFCGLTSSVDGIDLTDMAVIGNIYENQELIR
jgi:uncharacterized phage protein (TIGR01671 family)